MAVGHPHALSALDRVIGPWTEAHHETKDRPRSNVVRPIVLYSEPHVGSVILALSLGYPWAILAPFW